MVSTVLRRLLSHKTAKSSVEDRLKSEGLYGTYGFEKGFDQNHVNALRYPKSKNYVKAVNKI